MKKKMSNYIKLLMIYINLIKSLIKIGICKIFKLLYRIFGNEV
jgi:hypothetical protein